MVKSLFRKTEASPATADVDYAPGQRFRIDDAASVHSNLDVNLKDPSFPGKAVTKLLRSSAFSEHFDTDHVHLVNAIERGDASFSGHPYGVRKMLEVLPESNMSAATEVTTYFEPLAKLYEAESEMSKSGGGLYSAGTYDPAGPEIDLLDAYTYHPTPEQNAENILQYREVFVENFAHLEHSVNPEKPADRILTERTLGAIAKSQLTRVETANNSGLCERITCLDAYVGEPLSQKEKSTIVPSVSAPDVPGGGQSSSYENALPDY